MPPPAGGGDLAERMAAQARRFGPLPWSVFMEAALYDEAAGFYSSGGQAGRRGDFVTSPELGPLFASVVARALDAWWEELGRPDPFLVVEAGAGTGTLGRDVLAAAPACGPALRYLLVERSRRLREAQTGRLQLELPAFVLGPSGPDSADDDAVRTLPGRGPLATSLGELPGAGFTGIVIANELLDNLAFDLLEWRHDAWQEVRVAAAGPEGPGLIEALIPAPPVLSAQALNLVAGCRLAGGARVPIQAAATRWVRQALSLIEQGRLVLIDYAASTAVLACSDPASWLKTFRLHRPGGPPLEAVGSQDITTVVATDQLAAVHPLTSDRSQAEWLGAHGIAELADAARGIWRERAAIGDLEALKARSRVHEADALIDPDGLGAFRVLEWVVS
jgi:NADH dehydrogenase [ubiquinone] 1 alpha subcomplex assembly factor 7